MAARVLTREDDRELARAFARLEARGATTVPAAAVRLCRWLDQRGAPVPA